MIRVEESREDLQINMAPMIDMVFLLNLFFLTATVFPEIEREQEVVLPSAPNPASLSRTVEENLVINILQDGTVKIFGRKAEPAAIVPRVREMRERSRGTLKVMVRADRRTAYGNVAGVLAAVERAGVRRPFVVTRMVEIAE